MSVTRRGEPDARTSLGRPIIVACAATACSSKARLLESIGDATFGQIVRSHFDQDLVACQHTDAVLAHATGGVGDDLMFVFELDPERGVRKQFRHHTGKFQQFFLCHSLPWRYGNKASAPPRKARKLAESPPSHNCRVRAWFTRWPRGAEKSARESAAAIDRAPLDTHSTVARGCPRSRWGPRSANTRPRRRAYA